MFQQHGHGTQHEHDDRVDDTDESPEDDGPTAHIHKVPLHDNKHLQQQRKQQRQGRLHPDEQRQQQQQATPLGHLGHSPNNKHNSRHPNSHNPDNPADTKVQGPARRQVQDRRGQELLPGAQRCPSGGWRAPSRQPRAALQRRPQERTEWTQEREEAGAQRH